jgi:trk system potassium uptake protein
MNLLIRYLGYILLISAVFRIIPIVAGVIYNEPIGTFIFTAALSLSLGILLLWFGKHTPERSPFSLSQLNLPNALILISLSFIILPLIGAISFLPHFDYNILNALFESISGYTTTGLTLFNTLEGLPKSLLLWRAETQWIGGIGIIMVFLFIVSRLRFHGGQENTQIEATSSLYQAQGFNEKIEPSLRKSSKNVLIIYFGYTLLGIILLNMAGMGLFEAISLSFTSLSTGGFIVTDSLQATNSQLVILSVLMLLGSISFIAHNEILKMRFKEFFNSLGKNIFFLFLTIGVGLAFIVFRDLKVVFFELISAFTTTGYSITDISALPPLFIVLIMTGMLIGGSISSTSGGMKASRVYTLLMIVPWTLEKISSPRHAIITLKMRNKTVEEKDLLMLVAFATVFFLVMFIGTIVFLLLGYGLMDSSFQVASALGTSGLQTIELMPVPMIGKIVLILAMLLGRLEILPLLILIRKLLKLLS